MSTLTAVDFVTPRLPVGLVAADDARRQLNRTVSRLCSQPRCRSAPETPRAGPHLDQRKSLPMQKRVQPAPSLAAAFAPSMARAVASPLELKPLAVSNARADERRESALVTHLGAIDRYLEGLRHSAKECEDVLAKAAYPDHSTEYFYISSPNKDPNESAESSFPQGMVRRPCASLIKDDHSPAYPTPIRTVTQREPAPEPSCEIGEDLQQHWLNPGPHSSIAEHSHNRAACKPGRKQLLRPRSAEVPLAFERLYGQADVYRERRLQAAAQMRAEEDKQLPFRPQLRARRPFSARSVERMADNSAGPDAAVSPLSKSVSVGTPRTAAAGNVYSRLSNDAERRRRVDRDRLQTASSSTVSRSKSCGAVPQSRRGVASRTLSDSDAKQQARRSPSQTRPMGLQHLLTSPRSVIRDQSPVGAPRVEDAGGPEPDEVDLELLVLSLTGRLTAEWSKSLGSIRRGSEGRHSGTHSAVVGTTGSYDTPPAHLEQRSTGLAKASAFQVDACLDAHVEAASVFGGLVMCQEATRGSAGEDKVGARGVASR